MVFPDTKEFRLFNKILIHRLIKTNQQTCYSPFSSSVGGGMGGMNNMAGGMGIGMDRMSSGFDRLGPAMGGGPDRNMDIDRGFVPGPMGSGMRERLGSKGNQIFVRNVSI